MGYRLTVKGTIPTEAGDVQEIQGVLDRRRIDYKAGTGAITIDHFDGNMSPGDHRVEKALKELAGLLEPPATLTLWDEFNGESEISVGCGRVKSEECENVWSQQDAVPTPEEILSSLRGRGLAVRLTKVKGRRGRARQFEFQPLCGGPGCKVTVKRRFWDSYDLLAVPEVSSQLCERYRITPQELREKLYSSTFGMEVRNPAGGNNSTDDLYESLLRVIEDLTFGIKTSVG